MKREVDVEKKKKQFLQRNKKINLSAIPFRDSTLQKSKKTHRYVYVDLSERSGYALQKFFLLFFFFETKKEKKEEEREIRVIRG